MYKNFEKAILKINGFLASLEVEFGSLIEANFVNLIIFE